ncbi:MAG: hypothetical protein AAFQ95_20730 [Cyanobacteria bacterium J06621_3]
MQSVYWFCLTIGGVFVALSLVGGGDLLDDFDVDADADFDIDADFDADIDADFDADVDVDTDFDADIDADVDTDLQVDTDVELLRTKIRRRRRIPFLLSLLTSFKFWTFGGFFFGLTGLVLGATSPGLGGLIFVVALAMGSFCGAALAGSLRYLKSRQVDSLVRNEDFSGLVGIVELPFDADSKGKVVLEVGGSTLHLIARTEDDEIFQVGDRVLVVGHSENRLWVVSDKHQIDRQNAGNPKILEG